MDWKSKMRGIRNDLLSHRWDGLHFMPVKVWNEGVYGTGGSALTSVLVLGVIDALSQ